MSGLLTCPKCRALLDPAARKCPYCGTDVRHVAAPSPMAEIAHTTRLAAWAIGINIAVYALMIILDPARGDQSGFHFQPSDRAIEMFGVLSQQLVWGCGQAWRMLACVFLHFGVLHLLFNCVALAIVAPLAAHTFGPHRTVGVYVLGGIASSYVSLEFLGLQAISAGASGAICALIGAVGVYGKRRGGPEGQFLMRRMAYWGLFIVAYGFLMPGIDNAGHLGGFLGGGLVGWIAAQPRAWGGRVDRLWRLTAWICGLCLLGVLATGVIPSVVRGIQRPDVEFYYNESRRTLREIGRVLDREKPVDSLPEAVTDPPAGAEEVARAISLALDAARRTPPAESAVPLYAEATKRWRRWADSLRCRYGIGR